MTEEDFEEWWSSLSSTLKPGTEVFHWSAYSGYQLNGSFRIVRVEDDRVWVDIATPTLPASRIVQRRTLKGVPVGSPHEISINQIHYGLRENFLAALNLWGDYCDRTLTRETLDNRVSQSTYVISIIRWTEKNSR